MKNIKYLFIALGVSICFSYNVQAADITTKNDNITWKDADASSTINTGDEISVTNTQDDSSYNAAQQFHVLKNDGKYTYLLAMYNLNVGTYNVNTNVKIGITAPSIRAWINNSTPNYGTVELSELNTNLTNWLNNYKNELKNNYNFITEDIDLLSRDDAINYLLLTNSSEGTAYTYNSNKYANTSYWLKDMYDSSNKYFINGENNTINKQSSGYSGVRPVIKIQTKYLNNSKINYIKKQNIITSKNDICLNINNTPQCFTFLKKGENNTNYYFAKYNLNVGYYYNKNKEIGLQDSSIRAWVDSSTPNYGRVSYKTSKIYFQDYKDRLFNSGYNIISIDYLNKSDAETNYSLNHFVAEDSNSITTAYNTSSLSSIYANTTYWLKDNFKNDYYYYINAENKIGVANDVSGLRPVIQLSTLDITDQEKFNHGTIKYNENNSTIEVTPDNGYELDKLYILNSNGEYLDYKEIKANIYQFTKDSYNINISATFKKTNEESIINDNQIEENPNTNDPIFNYIILTIISFTILVALIRKKIRQ